ncbi:Hsp70 family protein [Mycolicibacterium hodleri]|uniref:Molecular chaperone n=1 Tax=Mycolicibacterium hodleri TaxID=49897 RepID=A0A502EKR5_9MYCO|nr:Hsp70 family protein [Mycolicibacterium hodleri]TPG37120.1 molecular chaperone [Mycolicibacterium hodleri]
MAQGIGLSIGATAFRAVAVGRSAVTRSPVLTLYPHRPAEVGVPSENPNLDERGLIITDFVDRVGDPVPIVASDGSSHRAEVLLADALRSLLLVLTGGRPPAEPVGVTYPAHWSPAAVEALRGALDQPALLTSDATAALTALQDDPGLPTRGIIALCDVGGTGASVTLADAANGFQPIGPTLRHTDFSGDLVDAALLSRVVADLATSGSVDLTGTSAIGSLSRLRGQCRAAKERLSTSSSTSLAVDMPGQSSEVRVTRTELDEAIRQPLGGFLDAIRDTLQRSGIRPEGLAAVAAVGGGARIPIFVTSLSEQLRAPVVTFAQPELAGAIGGGLKAVRALVPDGATSITPAALPASVPVVPLPPVDQGAPASSTFRALAWSDADDIPEPAAAEPGYEQSEYEPYDARPQIEFAGHEADAEAAVAPLPWYRRPAGILAIVLLAVLLAIGAVAFYALRGDESPSTAPSSTPVTTTPPPPASEVSPTASEAPPADPQAPPEQTVFQQAPPSPAATQEPPPQSETPPPTTEAPPPPPPTQAPTTAPSTVTEPPPSSTQQQPIIPTLPYQTIPGLPFVPAPIQPASP